MDANVLRTSANAGKDDYRKFAQSLAAAAGFEQKTEADGETLDFTDDDEDDEYED